MVGLDLSFNMLIQTRQYLARAGQHVGLVRADAKALPFHDGAFDVVHSHELSLFNHGATQDRLEALREQRRVCKKRGHIVLVLPTKDYEGSNFMPTDEQQMRYLFRHAGIQHVKVAYHLDVRFLRWFSTPGLLALVHRVLPRLIIGRLFKSPEEYLREQAFFILMVGKVQLVQ